MALDSITTVGTTVIGSGSDTLTLLLGEDQYLGNVEFLVDINGQQLGGIQTVTAIQSDNQDDEFLLEGNWGNNATVSIDFINPATNGFIGNGNDRELYVDGAEYNGSALVTPETSITGDFNNTSSITLQTSLTTDSVGANDTPIAPGGVGSSLNLTGYHLTYDEEFDSMPTMSPDAGEAQFTTTLIAYPNSEGMRILDNGDQEYYTDSTTGDDPFSISDGALDITATYVGAGNTPDGGGSSGPSYTSGQITTEGAFSQQYGYFEMRAELPQGAGMWPAFWMLNDNSYLDGGWNAEVDVLEAFGATASDGEGGATEAHWAAHSNVSSGGGAWATLPNGGNEYTGFHTYGVLWTPETLTYYIDGTEIGQTPTPSNYTQQMYMIVNLAVGGTWPGNATGENGTLKVDYLRAYSDNAGIPAVALQQISSPDGNSDTNMYGATALGGEACFLSGTHIATPAGDIPVESLSVGDQVLVANGFARSIRWIGKGRVLATRGRRNAATPVIVRKGAIADNVPYRDLHITRAHSLYIDGILIPVEFLVNHRSILWDDHAQEVSIYHIELETHDVLLANGAPAESYRDDGNRWLFMNANSGWELPPQEPCAPVLTGGPIVDAAWLRLLHRVKRGNGLPLTDAPDLHLLVDGRRLDAIEQAGNMYIFRLAGPPDVIRIVSRAAVPQELGLARDPRSLGVSVRQIIVRQESKSRRIDASSPMLKEGFHEFEPDIGLRWTTGDAAVDTNLFIGFTGPIEILLVIGTTMHYVDEGIPACGKWAAA